MPTKDFRTHAGRAPTVTTRQIARKLISPHIRTFVRLNSTLASLRRKSASSSLDETERESIEAALASTGDDLRVARLALAASIKSGSLRRSPALPIIMWMLLGWLIIAALMAMGIGAVAGAG